ncbi:MAG: cytochrome c [Bauldia litoralis]
MKLKLGLAVAAFAVAASGLAVANEDIIGLRKQAMKVNGQAAKVSVGMIKGEIPFNAEVAAAAMMLIADSSTEFVHLFPEGSETGDTKAGDAIWSDPDGFKAASKAAADAATAAATAAADGQEAFGAAFGAVGQACGACHEGYRKG